MTRDLVENNADEIIKLRTGIDINQGSDIGKLLENINTVPIEKNVNKGSFGV